MVSFVAVSLLKEQFPVQKAVYDLNFWLSCHCAEQPVSLTLSHFANDMLSCYQEQSQKITRSMRSSF